MTNPVNNNGEIFLEFDPYGETSTVRTATKYDLTFTLCHYKQGIKGNIIYYTKIFHQKTMQNFLECYLTVLNQLAQFKETIKSGKIEVGKIEFLSDSQKQILSNWKGEEKRKFDINQTLDELFDQVVENYPANTAVVYGEQSTTYLELDGKANILAHLLQKEVKIIKVLR